MSDTDAAPTVRIRTRGGLLVTAVVTMLLVTAPLFGVLYWFSARTGLWPEVLALHAIVTVACVLLGFRQLTIFTEVRDGVLRGNGIFSLTERVELSSIARVDLVSTYVGLAPAPVQQLLVRDAQGARLFRLRGNFWRPGALEQVAAALPVEPTVVSEPIDLREFFSRYPGSAYWFENRPAVLVVGIVLGVAGIAALVVAAIALIGEPTFF
jgi:hypothetical protein